MHTQTINDAQQPMTHTNQPSTWNIHVPTSVYIYIYIYIYKERHTRTNAFLLQGNSTALSPRHALIPCMNSQPINKSDKLGGASPIGVRLRGFSPSWARRPNKTTPYLRSVALPARVVGAFPSKGNGFAPSPEGGRLWGSSKPKSRCVCYACSLPTTMLIPVARSPIDWTPMWRPGWNPMSLPLRSQSPHSHLTVTSQLRHSYFTVTSWRNPIDNHIC